MFMISELAYVGENFDDIKYSFAIDLIFNILGTIYLYKCNGGANGKDFLQKYFSIGLVVGIRWLVLITLPTLILITVIISIFTNISDNYLDNFIDYVIIPILLLMYYWRAGIHIKDVAK